MEQFLRIGFVADKIVIREKEGVNLLLGGFAHFGDNLRDGFKADFAPE